jgi:hypothetical protein
MDIFFQISAVIRRDPSLVPALPRRSVAVDAPRRSGNPVQTRPSDAERDEDGCPRPTLPALERVPRLCYKKDQTPSAD